MKEIIIKKALNGRQKRYLPLDKDLKKQIKLKD